MRRLPLLCVLLLLAGCPAPSSTDGGADAGEPSDGSFHSSLFPDDWTPAFTTDAGWFLHDFSYAGYAQGEREPPRGAVTLRLELPDGGGDATALLQQSIDTLGANDGGVLLLGAGEWRIDGVLRVTTSGVVLRGEGRDVTRLRFTRTTGLSNGENLRFGNAPVLTQEWPLSADGSPRSFKVTLADAAGLSPGDTIALGHVITDDFVGRHGMTGFWRAFNGTWQPMLWRTVVAVTGNEVTLDAPLRNELRMSDLSSLRRATGLTREVGLEDLSVTNTIDPGAAFAMTQVHVVTFTGVLDGWMRNVSSYSLDGGAHVQSGGVLVHQSSRVTVSDSAFGLAQHRGGGGNGYLFEVRQSSDVLFRDDVGENGRHNFIQNWGFGTTGCVWLRVASRGGFATVTPGGAQGGVGYSEFHHSLATANLIDSSDFDDGFSIVNRRLESTGAGHTGTQNVFWNVGGVGLLRSMQWGFGAVVGTRGITVALDEVFIGDGTEPIDLLEGVDAGAVLQPQSLYGAQRALRLGR